MRTFEISGLSDQQYKLLKMRQSREFLIHCSVGRVREEIEEAKTASDLEQLATKRGLCDYSNFSDLDIEASKMILRVVAKLLYRYPKLRRNTAYIGSKASFTKAAQKLQSNDLSTLRRFNLQHITTPQFANVIGEGIVDIMNDFRDSSGTDIWAMAVSIGGFVNAVVVDEENFGTSSYERLQEQLKQGEKNGSHPKHCTSPESIIYHEFGHLLDELCGVSIDIRILEHYSCTPDDKITSGLSIYATTTIAEFVAEAFSEYMCNPMPRQLCVFVADILNGKYKSLK
jgi:hypothetical protein